MDAGATDGEYDYAPAKLMGFVEIDVDPLPSPSVRHPSDANTPVWQTIQYRSQETLATHDQRTQQPIPDQS